LEPGEKKKLFFTRKKVFSSPPDPLIFFKKSGVFVKGVVLCRADVFAVCQHREQSLSKKAEYFVY